MFGQGWVGAILASVFQQIFLNSDQQYDWFFFFLYNDKNLKMLRTFLKTILALSYMVHVYLKS